MKRTRDYRRYQEQKKKKKVASHDCFLWADKTPTLIGKASHTPKNCSCDNIYCGNPRKYWKLKTIQERRTEQNNN